MNPDTERFLALLPRYREHSDWKEPPTGIEERYLPEYNVRYFAFKNRELHMNYSTSIFLINQDVRALYVLFNERHERSEQERKSQQRYMVKTMDAAIKPGDYIIVAATARPHNLAVAEVIDVDVEVDFESATTIPWVVSRIDLAAFNELVAQEEEAIKAIRAANFHERRKRLADSLLSAREVRQLTLNNRKANDR